MQGSVAITCCSYIAAPVRRQVRQNTVIPAKAGIQRNGANPSRLDSGFRRNDKKMGIIPLITQGVFMVENFA